MNARRSPIVAGREPRRGVLLLVVLSMLTLFLMLGAAYVVSATRAREAARAYARLTFAGDEARVPHARLLDGVLLRVLRGGADPTATNSPSFESLLADKYGTTSLPGTADGFNTAAPSPAVLFGTLTLPSPVRPFDLNGRLVSFVEPGRPVTTHRIIRAANSNGSNSPTANVDVAIDASSRPGPFVGPKSTTRAIVNGREFDGSGGNEPWDGFDSNNPYLAQVGPGSTISRSSVSRISYFPTFNASSLTANLDNDGDLVPDAADNDNDGVYDGLFMDFGIPDAADANGNNVNLRASVLIVDLDGRFNVNAHDSLSRLIYAGTSGWSPLVSQNIPMGSGYGPAEVNGMTGTRCWTSNTTSTSGTGLFPGPPTGALLGATNTFATSEQPMVFTLTGGPASRFVGQRSGTSGSRYTDGESTPRLSPVEGKYGERAAFSWQNIVPNVFSTPSSASFALPGQPATDDEASRLNDRRADLSQPSSVGYGVPPIWWTGTDSAFNWRTVLSISGSPQPAPRGTFNSPPDLHGRMRTFTGAASAIVPRLGFAKAEWSGTAPSASHESKDDPYELRLDTRLGFGGLLFDPTAGESDTSASSIRRDNPFTAAELEAVLRPYDIDTNRLPPRLPAMLGSAGEEARLKITTDSWDTTAITGSAATVLSAWLSGAAGSLYGASAVGGIIGGEVGRGERFDLNRPLAAADVFVGYPAGALSTSTYHLQRAAYCKDLYTLLLACGAPGNAVQLAQWAANVAEFRDADSRIVPFEYDTNPLNGWDVDGDVTTSEGGDRNVVWGAERPEIVIQEAFAWRNTATGNAGMSFTLHRPWNAVASGSVASVSIAAEPCDYALDVLDAGTTGRPQNIVNLGKKAAADLYTAANAAYNVVSGTTYPIWRMRIAAGGSNYYVRFDTDTAQPDEFVVVDPGVTSGTATPKLGSDETITFRSGATVVTGSGMAIGSVTLPTLPASAVRTVSGLSIPPGVGSATLSLERLSDPTLPLTQGGTIPGTSITGSAVWFGAAPATAPVRYIAVDSVTVTVNDTAPSINFSGTTFRRSTSGSNTDFWRTASGITVNASNGNTLSIPQALTTGSTAWMAWPNRPFVSSAELLLVPQGNANEILQNYQRLSPALSGSVQSGWSIPVPTSRLFDAVHVPTRFAGIHRTTTQNLAASLGIFNAVTAVNQLSSFREPGRVNLNTVLADDVWNAVVAGPLPSSGVPSRSAAGLTSTPARSMVAALALSGGGAGTVVSDTTSPQLAVNLNPLHGIYTATRLANTVTPRSNVFAVWITLRESVANDPDSVRYRRAFYIVDRSIPVAFENGRDTNVWDCVRVRRIIE